MKVKITPIPHINKNYGYEFYFTPVCDLEGDILGYEYGTGGWYGQACFLDDLKMGLISIIEDFKPKQELKKLSLI
jgi:hypothetical protein